jgi:hypothetical protein
MRTLPAEMIRVLAPFAPLFSERVFGHVQVLLAGAILAPGKRTVSSALRVMGLEQQKRFHRYHRVLSRAAWSSREASRVLLDLLVEAFVPEEGAPLGVGIDETLERRQGKKIAPKGIYRDPVRSSHTHFVKTSGLTAGFSGIGPCCIPGCVDTSLEGLGGRCDPLKKCAIPKISRPGQPHCNPL